MFIIVSGVGTREEQGDISLPTSSQGVGGGGHVKHVYFPQGVSDFENYVA